MSGHVFSRVLNVDVILVPLKHSFRIAIDVDKSLHAWQSPGIIHTASAPEAYVQRVGRLSGGLELKKEASAKRWATANVYFA